MSSLTPSGENAWTIALLQHTLMASSPVGVMPIGRFLSSSLCPSDSSPALHRCKKEVACMVGHFWIENLLLQSNTSIERTVVKFVIRISRFLPCRARPKNVHRCANFVTPCFSDISFELGICRRIS